MWPTGWFTGIAQDVRYAIRGLRRGPGFTATALVMLAAGIGINAAVFTVSNAVLFKGFPLVDCNDRLLYISNGGCCISYPDFADIRAEAKSFSGMGVTHGIAKVVNDGNGFAEHLDITEVSPDTFRTVGRQPILGRDFTAGDDLPGAAPVVVLSYGLWQRRYGKAPSIIGRSIRMNGVPTRVIGIMPRGFSFPQTVDAWVPLVQTAKVLRRESTDTWFAFGRLKEGVTFQRGRAEVETIIKRLETAYPVTDTRSHLVVGNFAEFFIGPNAAALYGSMWAAVGFVLLMACANLANLLLARSVDRSREISVRIAIGAGRWRIVRQFLIESVILSGAGGVLGWWVAKWSVRTYELAMARKASWLILDYTMDGRVLGYLIFISIATGILFGLAPAFRLWKPDVNAMLKAGARGGTGGARGKSLSDLLVTGEMALAIILLAGAGVMIRSFLKIHNANMGVAAAKVLCASLDLPASRYASAEQRISFYDRLMRRLEAVPGVESVALADSLPSWNTRRVPYALATSEVDVESSRRPRVPVLPISPVYFGTVNASVLAGRDFNKSDGNMPVAIVNRLLANKFWPGEDPIGKRLRVEYESFAEKWLTVVGVVSNIVQNDATRQRMEPLVYLPYWQNPKAGIWVLARTRVPPERLVAAARREVQTLDADLPVYGPFALTNRLEFYWDSSFYGTLFLIFAAIALLLASIGLYTVVAHSVGRRTREIGIRIAVGASPWDIMQLISAQGMRPLGIGLTVGLVGSLAVNRILKSALVQVSPSDPLTLVVASGVLISAGLLGCWIPARRAMRVDPAAAVRHE
jgi:predicted permease